MRLWLTSDNVDWDAGRFRYPAEQMLFTLFPGEKAEYPTRPPLPPWRRSETPPSLPSTGGRS